MCDTLVAVTDDGLLFGKNSDRDPNEAQAVRSYPAAEHAPGALVQCTWSTIPQVAATAAVVLSQPWWMWGAEMGANEHGVVIGNEAVFTRGAREAARRQPAGTTDGPLLGMDLLRLALERSRTAREAVETIVTLLERHGQGGSCSHEHPSFTYDNSFLVADPDGAVVLETAGRHHATQAVTGPGRSISNGLTIPGFADRFADPVRGRVARCAVRRARTEAAATEATRVQDVVAALRDHGGDRSRAGGGSPAYALMNGALGAPCAHAGGLVTSTQTTASWASDLTGSTPRHLATGTAAPCLSVFVPVDVLTTAPTDAPLTDRYDPAHRWWRHELLHRAALRDPAAALARLAPARDRLEADLLAPSTAPTTTLTTTGTNPASDVLAAVDAHEARALADLADLPDRRPTWLRTLWRRWDTAAGLPTNLSKETP